MLSDVWIENFDSKTEKYESLIVDIDCPTLLYSKTMFVDW